MVERALDALASWYSAKNQIDIECAKDITDHIQTVVTDTHAGLTLFPNTEAVLREYGIPEHLAWAFDYSIDTEDE